MTVTRVQLSRRHLLHSSLGGLALAGAVGLPRLVFGQGAPAVMISERQRIRAPFGVQSGDVGDGRAIVWSKADRPARMLVRWSTREDLADARAVRPLHVLEDTDFTGKVELTGLPDGERIFYEVRFLDLGDLQGLSEPVRGSFLTPPASRRRIRFLWSGDLAGQGYGINPDFGGFRIFRAMKALEPDFFVFSGDAIYADGPIPAEIRAADGSIWRNLVVPAKEQVAETLADFRGNYAYNLMDENFRLFLAEVPVYAQWDDHEVTNNWYWELRKDSDQRYKDGAVARLAARAMRAFHEYMPTRLHPLERDRIFESLRYGPSLELFRIDLRSYRGPNTAGLETALAPETRILGERQVQWLKAALKASRATWKVICCDMPLGLIVWDNAKERRGSEAVAQGDPGAPRGRELEIADLLRYIRDEDIRNIVWITADVHYTAAHYYDPSKAVFKDFRPFWEFVSGPLNAGTFGPNELDPTFGPQVVFQKAPPPGQANLPPSAGMQFFGEIEIAPDSETMTVRLRDLEGGILFSQELLPEV
ncbi:Alkaline phosphatase D [bacterium HR40]|nr:Alkaline phosphatase D [bacterium HR40]